VGERELPLEQRSEGRAGSASATEISLQAVSKTYRSKRGDIVALRDISLDIQSGQFVSLVGPSGCGKSTLLRCIAGLETPTEGTLYVHGEKLVGFPKSLGVVFQNDVLLDWRNVLENVLLPLEFRKQEPKQWTERALAFLRGYGLAGFEYRYPWELSGGMRQRVSICRAMIDNPSLMLMDEPFAALDAFTRDELNLELQRIWLESTKTVVFVTHSIPEAVFLADQVVVMASQPGRIVETIAVDLPRPRTLAVRDTAEFGSYARRVRETFERLGLFKTVVG
jgi:NitT/TauT family transport system ATP-binding protein